MAHSTKKLAVSLVALLVTLALFATLSAVAQGVPATDATIIDPAIDEAAHLPVAGDAMGHRGPRRLGEDDVIRMRHPPAAARN